MSDARDMSVEQAQRWFQQADWKLRERTGEESTWTKNSYIARLPTQGRLPISRVLMMLEVTALDRSALEPIS